MLDEGRGLGEGGFGAVAAQGQSSLAGYGGPDAGHDPRSSAGHFLVVRAELLGRVEPRRLVHHAVGQRGEVVALF